MMKLTQQSIATGNVDELLAQIAAWTEGVLTYQVTGGALTADGTEQTIYIDNEPFGAWKPLALYLDLDAMLAGDTIEIRAYHRMTDGGGLQLTYYGVWGGPDGGLLAGKKLIRIDLGPNRHGFQVTLQQIAGVNREYPWELYVEV